MPVEDLDFADVFFKEVSEDVHNDNLKAFWKKYGAQIVVGVALCLTIAVSFETIKHWIDVQNQKWSDAFAYSQILIKQGKENESISALTNIEKNGNDIYSDIAQLETINLLLEKDQKELALKKLEDFILSANNDKLKNLALMKLVSYKVDTASASELKALIQPLMNTVWASEAKEFVALAHLRNNEKDKALEIYNEISSSHNISDILRARAQNMISVLTISGENNQ